MIDWADLLGHPSISELLTTLSQGRVQVVNVAGLWGSFGPLLVGLISRQVARPILYVRPHIEDALRAVDDLETFGIRADLLAAWDHVQQIPDPADQISAARIRLILRSWKGMLSPVICGSIQGLGQPVPTPQTIDEHSLELSGGKEVSVEALAAWLTDNGFEPVDRVETPGQFARRGGIVDVFAPVADVPGSDIADQGMALRIEFFGDSIETIRRIDLDTQRSTGLLEQVRIISGWSGDQQGQVCCLTEILPSHMLVVIEEPADCQQVLETLVTRSGRGLFGWAEVYKGLSCFCQVHMSRFGVGPGGLVVDVRSVQQYQIRYADLEGQGTRTFGNIATAMDQLVCEAASGKKVYLFCQSAAELQRLQELLSGKLPAGLHLVQGYLSGGFAIESLGIIVVTHHELFGQHPLRRIQRPSYQTESIDTLADLQQGDYVVHAVYGIGRFLGLETIEASDGKGEYLAIEYADKAKVYVSASNIHLVQRYIGTGLARPRLSKIGSRRWQRQKEKVAAAVSDLAAEMLMTQARRKAMGGFAFGPDSHWQQQFEASFPYVETPDQTLAISQIKEDMARPIAMDRLLCGDVGYGKTELAMRAAFKAVESGKQVAVLVPTTVLSVQHGRTFVERFADFPVCIEVLNRFRSPSEVADILDRTKKGGVDILIGTHRLLSDDVVFKDLGLVIIDEEQRFGVEHKERLKRMKVDVDVLTMTATPIPRTLHMSMLGLRDISCLSTPPLDRRSIVTTVVRYSDQLIRDAILNELDRGGQVFYLHNRVKTIDKCAQHIRKLLADTNARIAVAHGQMGKLELEQTMVDFVEGRIDVLVCTTIIESGLDIPNANTIIIEDADRFGLAELHQLRGRVGRYWRRAYAYMLLPRSRPLLPRAAKRLKAIEEYSQLGSGFKIALRDLEIRGAGNILGPEQSGYIQAVGYHMYCQLLAEAVRRLRNEQVSPTYRAAIDLGLTISIPRSYIPSDRLRMEVYRRIAQANTKADLDQVAEELRDIYGPIPQEVDQLLQWAQLRLDAGAYGLESVTLREGRLVFSFRQANPDKAGRIFAHVKAPVRIPDPRTVVMELPDAYREGTTLLAILRKLLTTGRHPSALQSV